MIVCLCIPSLILKVKNSHLAKMVKRVFYRKRQDFHFVSFEWLEWENGGWREGVEGVVRGWKGKEKQRIWKENFEFPLLEFPWLVFLLYVIGFLKVVHRVLSELFWVLLALVGLSVSSVLSEIYEWEVSNWRITPIFKRRVAYLLIKMNDYKDLFRINAFFYLIFLGGWVGATSSRGRREGRGSRI